MGWVLVFGRCDLYRTRAVGSKVAAAVVRACTYAAVLRLIAGFFFHFDGSRLTIALAYLFSIPALLAGRTHVRRLMGRAYSDQQMRIPLAIIGFNDLERYLFDQVSNEVIFTSWSALSTRLQSRQYRSVPVCKALRISPSWPGFINASRLQSRCRTRAL